MVMHFQDMLHQRLDGGLHMYLTTTRIYNGLKLSNIICIDEVLNVHIFIN